MDPDALLDAHVAFELRRWTDEGVRASVAEEVDAAFAWLETVTPGDLVDTEQVVDAVLRVAERVDGDEVARVAGTVAPSLTAASVADGTRLADVVDRADVDRLVDLVVDLEELRGEVIRQVTQSEVYGRLLAHVLYHGLKAYVLTENVVARRVPGASSLLRLGQSAMSTAVPRLEKGIDRQLTAFVSANIADSIRESRRYLDDALDEAVLREAAEEVWTTNAGRPLGDVGDLVPPDAMTRGVAVVTDLVAHAVTTDAGRAVLRDTVSTWLADKGGRSVADLLAEAGLTAERVADAVAEAVTPLVARARADGYLEQRIRARLAPFYATL